MLQRSEFGQNKSDVFRDHPIKRSIPYPEKGFEAKTLPQKHFAGTHCDWDYKPGRLSPPVSSSIFSRIVVVDLI